MGSLVRLPFHSYDYDYDLFFFSSEKAISLKDEGNEYFHEKNYKRAVLAYTAGLKVKCDDQVIDTILLTNRAAAQYYLGMVVLLVVLVVGG